MTNEILAAVFVSMLWARVSDIGIAEQGLPSLAVPFGLGLAAVAIGRRLRAGEPLGAVTFERVFPLLPYLAVVAASVLWASAPERSLSAATDVAKDVLIFWIVVEVVHTSSTLEKCCVGLVVTAGALSALSVYQDLSRTFTSDYGGFALAPVRQIVGQVNSFRSAGPVGDPNFYALILLVTVPLGLALVSQRRPAITRLLLLACVLLISSAVLLTYSRGGVLVLAGGWLISLLRLRRRGAQIVPLTLLPVLLLTLAPGQVRDRMATLLQPFADSGHVGRIVDGSVELRLGAQRVALEMFLDHPFTGVGAANYPALYPDYSRDLGVVAAASEFYPHNLYLQVAAETGSLGLATFIPAVFGPLAALELTRRATASAEPLYAEWQALAFGIEVALGCYLAASLMLHGSYPRYLWLLLGLAVSARRLMITRLIGV